MNKNKPKSRKKNNKPKKVEKMVNKKKEKMTNHKPKVCHSCKINMVSQIKNELKNELRNEVQRELDHEPYDNRNNHYDNNDFDMTPWPRYPYNFAHNLFENYQPRITPLPLLQDNIFYTVPSQDHVVETMPMVAGIIPPPNIQPEPQPEIIFDNEKKDDDQKLTTKPTTVINVSDMTPYYLLLFLLAIFVIYMFR